MDGKLQNKTIEDFGEQWKRYTDNSGFYASAELFADMLEPLLSPSDLAGRVVAEIGSGSGRIVGMILAAGADKVFAVEPAAEAFATLERNTAPHRDRIVYLNLPGEALPADLNADYVLSIGVIHHIPDPRPTLAAALKALKPGGKCLIWVYGREGNQSYLRLVEPLRRLTTRLPHPLLAGISHALNFVLGGYIFLARHLPIRLPLRDYMREVIGRMDLKKRYLVVYDQLNPAYAKYYTEAEARALLVDAGFADVGLHHRHGYSWTVIGTRPQS